MNFQATKYQQSQDSHFYYVPNSYEVEIIVFEVFTIVIDS